MASRPPVRRSSSPLRTALIAAVVFLAVNLVAALAYRSVKKGRAEGTPEAVATPPVDSTANPRADMALLRAHRAQAVDAIETGDYEAAVKTLTEIVKSGRGVGDEPELLHIAKDLQEKHAQKAASPPAAVAMREPPEEKAAPAPPVAAKETRPEPKEKEPPPSIKEKKPDPKHPAKAPKPPPREERKVASAKPVPVIPDREPESGQVLVMSVPSGLSAEVDGTPAGNTPTRYTTAPGVHTVALYKGTQRVAERTVTVSENSVATADFDIRDQLQPAPVVLKEREPEKEKESAPPPPEEKQPEKARVDPPALPPTTPASAVAGMGEVMVPPMSLAGNVYINGKSYGPPPVLARDVPAGSATVELRVGDAVKRSKVVPVEAHQRATVKFR
jgi:hypothetical protein